jgi:hypothetical protein
MHVIIIMGSNGKQEDSCTMYLGNSTIKPRDYIGDGAVYPLRNMGPVGAKIESRELR